MAGNSDLFFFLWEIPGSVYNAEWCSVFCTVLGGRLWLPVSWIRVVMRWYALWVPPLGYT